MDRDPGLQAERTALAWSRTALAMLVNALILLRAGVVGVQGVQAHMLAIGMLLLAAAGLTQAFAARRRQALAGQGRFVAAPVPVLVGTAALIAFCSGCALWVLAGRLTGLGAR